MIIPGDESGYIFSDIEKIERLHNLPSPKIILVGGSNIAMGVDSEILEKKMKIPVVNMGLHAGLGIRFLFERVRTNIKQGDIVIISPEYENFFNDFYNGFGPIIGGTIAALPRHVQYISNNKQVYLLISNMNFILNARVFNLALFLIKRITNNNVFLSYEAVYSRNSINKWGDVVSHLKKNSPSLVLKDIPDFSVRINNYEIYNYLNEINDYITSKGGFLYFSFPSFAETVFKKNKKSIEAIFDCFRDKVKINHYDSPDMFIYKDQLFFDNYYHLNRKGRNKRTKMLLKNLQTIVKK